MRKTFIIVFLILMVCGLVSSAYAEKMVAVELAGKILNQERIKTEKPEKMVAVELDGTMKPGKIKIESFGTAVGKAVKIVDSQGKPVRITDEAGKPLNVIVGSKGNLVVQKATSIQKPGVVKQEILKLEKPTITRPTRPQKPEFTKPQPITNNR